MSGSTGDCPLPACGAKRASCFGPVVRAGCQGGLALTFLLSGASKFARPEMLLDQLTERVGLSFPGGVALASLLPALELVCGLCLALNVAVREAAAVLAALLLVFIGYLFVFGGTGDCQCFVFSRATHTNPWWGPIVRNGFLLGCCVPVVRGAASRGRWRWFGRPLPALVGKDGEADNIVQHVEHDHHGQRATQDKNPAQ